MAENFLTLHKILPESYLIMQLGFSRTMFERYMYRLYFEYENRCCGILHLAVRLILTDVTKELTVYLRT